MLYVIWRKAKGMGIISLRDGVASSVGAVRDFSVLRRLVAADEQGLLFASHVRVECSLIDEPYDEVVKVIAGLRTSNVQYDFPLVSSFCVKDDSGWDAVQLDLKLHGARDGYECHVFSELQLDDAAFEEMRSALKHRRCLLLSSMPHERLAISTYEGAGIDASMNLH